MQPAIPRKARSSSTVFGGESLLVASILDGAGRLPSRLITIPRSSWFGMHGDDFAKLTEHFASNRAGIPFRIRERRSVSV